MKLLRRIRRTKGTEALTQQFSSKHTVVVADVVGILLVKFV
jgi:hypothetical protein